MGRLRSWLGRLVQRLTTRRALAVLGAVAVSAVLLRLSFPVPGWYPLAWVALVPWLVVVRAGSGREALWGSAAMGFAAALLGLSWQFAVTLLGGVLLAVYVGAYCVLFAWLVRAASGRLRVPFVVAAPVLWAGGEYLRSFAFTGFPWLFVGHTQQPFTALIQVCDLFGAYALSFLVVAANAFVAEAVLAVRRRPLPWARLAAGGAFVVVLVGATLAYGHACLARVRAEEGPRVGIVQTSVPQDIKNERTLETITTIFLTMTRMTRTLVNEAGSETLDLVVWPESMVQWPLNRPDYRPAGDFDELLARLASELGTPPPKAERADYRPLLVGLAREIGCPILVGAHAEIGTDDPVLAVAPGIVQTVNDREIVAGDYAYSVVPYTDPETGKLPVLRAFVREGQRVGAGDTLGEVESLAYNSAYLVRPDGFHGRYDKNHLVPFGEYVPLGGLLWFLRTVVPYGKGFSAGDRLNLMEAAGARFGVLICFEDVFPRLIRRFVARPDGGADFLINISNDGWFRGSHELDQHLAMCALRAVEFRIGIVRCCNTGISAILGPDGRIHQMVRRPDGRYKNVEGRIIGRVALRQRLTFYARHGDLLGQVCLAFAALVFLATLLASVCAGLRRGRREGSALV